MKSEYFINKELFRKNFITLLEETFVINFDETTISQQYYVLVDMTRKSISHNWNNSNKRESKKVYSFYDDLDEGKVLLNNLVNLNIKDMVFEVLSELNINIDKILQLESYEESNCMSLLESSATLSLNLCAVSPRNKKSLWEVKKDIIEEVKVGGNVYFSYDNNTLKCIHENYKLIKTQAYDTPIIGYDNNVVNTIRRWSCNEYKEYIYISATIQNILKNQKDINTLYENVIFNIDEKSGLVAIELMRLLIDEYNFSWDGAYFITTKCCVYNHNVEFSFDSRSVKENYPRLYLIIEELNCRNNHCIISDKINMNNMLASMFLVFDCLPTNISHRKWCYNVNNDLVEILNEYCDSWITTTSNIKLLNKSITKRKLQKKFRDMRAERKKAFCNAISLDYNSNDIYVKIEKNNVDAIINLYASQKDRTLVNNIVFIIKHYSERLSNITNDLQSKIKIIYNDDSNLLVGAIDVIDNYNIKYLLNGCVYINTYEENCYELLDKLYCDEIEFNKKAITSVVEVNDYLSDSVLNNYNNKIWKI